MDGIKISELLEVLAASDDDLLVVETENGTKSITKENLLKEIYDIVGDIESLLEAI